MKHIYKKPSLSLFCLIIVLNNVAVIESSYSSTTDSLTGSPSTHLSSAHSSRSLETNPLPQCSLSSSAPSLESASINVSSLPEMSTFKYRSNQLESPSNSLISAPASENSQAVNTFRQQWWKDINNADREAYKAIISKNSARAAEFTQLAQKRRDQFEAIETLVAGLTTGNAKNQQWLTKALDYCDRQASTETNPRIGLMFKNLAQKWKSELIKHEAIDSY